MKTIGHALYHGICFVLLLAGLVLFYLAGVRSLNDDLDEANEGESR